MKENQVNYNPGYVGQNFQNYRSEPNEQKLSTFNDEHMNQKQVSHCNAEPGFNPEFTSFDKLPPLAENVDYEALLLHIRDNFENHHSWYLNFQAVNEVRSLYKSMPQNVNEILTYFGNYLLNGLSHVKIAVTKVCLMAINDFYQFASKFKIEWRFSSGILNCLMAMYSNLKPTIKVPLQTCIEAVIDSCLGDEVIQLLCEYATNHKNAKYAYKGFTYLAHALNKCKNDVHLFEQKTNMMIFKTLYYVLDNHKFGDAKEVAKNILKFYFEKMGDESFKDFLKHLMNAGFMTGNEAVKLYDTAKKDPNKPAERISMLVQSMKNNSGPGNHNVC